MSDYNPTKPEDPEYTLEVGTPIAQDVVDLYYRNDFTKHATQKARVGCY